MLKQTSGGLLPPCLKQGQLEQLAQGLFQFGFDYLQVWRLHNLSRLSLKVPIEIMTAEEKEKLSVFKDIAWPPFV